MSEPSTSDSSTGHSGSDEASNGLRISRDGAVLRVTIDRPSRKGSLTQEAMATLIQAFEAAATDDSLRCVMLSGTGDNFCSGADWVATNAEASSKPRTGSIQRRTPVRAHRLIAAMLELQLPIICGVRGWAAGLGCQLALASDFTIVSETATLWLPFTERGFTPDSGATWMLPRLVGVARAKDLLLLGRKIDGRLAAAWGMVHGVVSDSELDAATESLVATLANGPTVAIGLTKRAIHAGLETGLTAALEREALNLELSSRAPDFREGLAAFKDRRPPDFTGR